MEKLVLWPILLGFLISLRLGKILIPVLQRLKMGQMVREEGVQSHLKKAGTPTMGGVIFLGSIGITSMFYIGSHSRMIPVLFLTLAFGCIGFLDDYLKVVKKNSDGLSAIQKMGLQVIVTGLFLFYLLRFTQVSLEMRIPFYKGGTLNLGWGAMVLLFFAVIGTVNGTNFTDGLDGLASTVTVVIAGFFLIASLLLTGKMDPFPGIVLGSLLGFLVYNVYPAKVFMGDTGSLALGGFVAGMAYMLQLPIFILLVGLIYLVEVLSVMIQVVYFKKTGGKRIFKMAPIHHHFELCGWSETRVVAVFGIVTFLLCVIGIVAL